MWKKEINKSKNKPNLAAKKDILKSCFSHRDLQGKILEAFGERS